MQCSAQARSLRMLVSSKQTKNLNAACASFASKMGVNRVRVLLGHNIMNVDSEDGTFTVSVSVN